MDNPYISKGTVEQKTAQALPSAAPLPLVDPTEADRILRQVCLQYAVTTCINAAKSPADIVKIAGEYYDFIRDNKRPQAANLEIVK